MILDEAPIRKSKLINEDIDDPLSIVQVRVSLNGAYRVRSER